MSTRKKVPRDIEREIYIEAGYRCPVPKCDHEMGLEIHHIDKNPNNNDPKNLLLLCAIHHTLATSGKMDRKACRKIKESLSTEPTIPFFPDANVIKLPTRKKYNDAVIESIESGPELLRAIIVGPHFLHPQRLMDRRLERERRKSFSLTLRSYLEDSLNDYVRDVRLIIRNNNRYLDILKPLVRQNEVHNVIQEMKSDLHTMFYTPKSRSTISFCCMDLGYYHGVIITESSCFVTGRKTDQSKIEYGYEVREPNIIGMELKRFEEIFEENFKGQDEEIALLESYITSLEHFILIEEVKKHR